MAQFAEIEIALRRREAAGYPVEMRYVAIGSDTDERIPAREVAHAAIEPKALEGLDPLAYGQTLGTWLFADQDLLVGFEKARDSLQAADVQERIEKQGDPCLRVRLYIDAGAEELHRLHWETLCDSKGQPIFNGKEVLLSRYLASRNWHAPQGKADLKALIVVADPRQAGRPDPWDPELYDPDDPDTSPKLAAVDVAAERQRAEAGFDKTGIKCQTLATGQADSLGPATLENLLTQLDTGIDILYLVCHGALMHDGVARLYLEDGLVDASKLVTAMQSRRQLRLVVLVSCESAGAQGTGASGTLSAFGPMLVNAGVPAVIAMQGKVKMTTAARFMPEFFKALARGGGQIDRAIGAARAAALDAGCDDYWMPVLFMRLRTGRLWYVPGLGGGSGGSDTQTWDRINDAIRNQRSTPILGPGMLEPLIGSTRQLARALGDNRFPFSAEIAEELPTVAQYIAVYLSRPLAAKEELARLITRRLPAVDGVDPGNPRNLSRLLRAAGKAAREANPLEGHRVLASRDFPIYVTANPDALMEDALREAGKAPRSDFSRWNTDPWLGLWRTEKDPPLAVREPDYKPTPDQPLVYHLFGMLDLPEPVADPADAPGFAGRDDAGLGSVALTEDDFFNYLLRIGSKADAKDDLFGPVSRSLVENSLLFVGFRLDEWSFRVLLRSIFEKEGSQARLLGQAYPCVGAQIEPEEDRVRQPARASKYFEQYMDQSKIDIFWGSATEFIEAFVKHTSAGAVKVPA